jgi:hypothetical protein
MKIALACLCTLSLFSAHVDEKTPNPSDIRVVSVTPTPEADHVEVYISYPENGEIKKSMPIDLKFRTENFPLGVHSDFPRASEIYDDTSEGQALRIVVDDQPFLQANEALDDALDDYETDFDQSIEIDLKGNLTPGMHVLRIYPARSYGESLKGDKCFAASTFYYKEKKDNLDFNPKGPYLTYNEPQGVFSGSKPILLDFYLTNCQLSNDGYKVKLTIDGKIQRTLTQWAPYYIYGLGKGSHTIKLELLDNKNKKVSGIFSQSERKISVR